MKVSTWGAFEEERKFLINEILKKSTINVSEERLKEITLTSVINEILLTSMQEYSKVDKDNFDFSIMREIQDFSFKRVIPTIEKELRVQTGTLSDIKSKFEIEITSKIELLSSYFYCMQFQYDSYISNIPTPIKRLYDGTLCIQKTLNTEIEQLKDRIKKLDKKIPTEIEGIGDITKIFDKIENNNNNKSNLYCFDEEKHLKHIMDCLAEHKIYVHQLLNLPHCLRKKEEGFVELIKNQKSNNTNTKTI